MARVSPLTTHRADRKEKTEPLGEVQRPPAPAKTEQRQQLEPPVTTGNALHGESPTRVTLATGDIYGRGQSVSTSIVNGHEVTGAVLSHGVDSAGNARATIRFTGVAMRDVIEMFTKEDLRSFFPTARSYGRRALEDGGQAMLENPMPGPPIMYTEIHPDADGIHSTFKGLVYGGSKITLTDDGRGGIVLDENTAVRPSLKDIPGESLLESVPFFGRFQKAGRELVEQVAGVALAGLHAAMVPSLAIDAMVETLAKRVAARSD